MSFEKELSFYADFLNSDEGEKAGFLVITDSESEMSKFLELSLGCMGEREKRANIKPMFYTDKVLWRSPNLIDFIQNKEYVEELKAYLDLKKSDGDDVIDYIVLFLHKEITSEILSLIQKLDSYNERLIVMLEKPELSLKCQQGDNKPKDLFGDELDKLSSLGLLNPPIVYSVGEPENADGLPPYNLAKFLYYILGKLPENKRSKLLSHSINVMNLSSSKNTKYNDEQYYISQLRKYDLENQLRKTNKLLGSNHKFVQEMSELSKQLVADLRNNLPKEDKKTKQNVLNNAVKIGAGIVASLGLLGLYRVFKNKF